MKNKPLILLFFVAAVLMAATVVKKVSDFPSVTTPGTNDLFLLASGATNKNIKYSDLRTSIRGGTNQAANSVMATPDGVTGTAGLRALVAADIPSLPASKIGSGTLDTNRLPALVKDLGALSGVTGDVFYFDGTHLIRLPIGPAGYLLVVSNGVPAYSTNFASGLFTNLTVVTNNVTVLNVSQTIKINGKAATVFSANGVELPIANLEDSSTAVLGGSGTNITVNPTNLSNAQISGSAAIAKSKISTSGTWPAADLPTIQSTADGGTSAVKLKNYLVLAFPHNCDGTGAIIATNDNTQAYFGQAAFSGSSATNANWVEYRITVPEDIDTSVDLKVERWKVRLGAADTAAQTYNIGMASIADSASYDSPTLGQWTALSLSADASGASGDVETVSNVTLTGWRTNVTAGRLWVIRVNRDGAGDASTQASYSGPLVISYGSTQ